ncbi:hypothetical protein LCGC14_2474290, partial [marine sediment metagenome]
MADTLKLRVIQGDAVLEKLDDDHPDLDRALKALSAKLDGYEDIWNYYDGDQPLMYTSGRLRDIFKDLDMATFVENWCAVIIDAANDRINLRGVTLEDKTANDALKVLWEELGINLEADDVHEAALVIGEAYIMVWKDDEAIDVVYNDPRLVHLFYESANPKKKWYGAKWWADSKDHLRITLYYDDRLEYYRSEKETKNTTSVRHLLPYSPIGEKDADGEVDNVETHEFGEVPIFHYRLERRKVKGDIVNVIPLQNGINKLVTDMMVSAEFGAFPQRWAITDSDIGDLKNAPDEVWWIPSGDGTGQQAAVGQFKSIDLKVFIEAVDHLASSAAIISRTPKHFLFQQGGDPSGEALVAMEAPLNKRCSDHIERFNPVWKEVVQFILKLAGTDIEKKDIAINF